MFYIFAEVFKYFALFHPFPEKTHPCLYFLEYALDRVFSVCKTKISTEYKGKGIMSFNN